MPLPPGFKVNGFKTVAKNLVVPPRSKKIIQALDALPASELLTTRELIIRLGLSNSGSVTSSLGVDDYREKVDGKLFWGSKKSIAQLRKHLAEPEEINDEN